MKRVTQTVHEHQRIDPEARDRPFLKKFVPSILTRSASGEFRASSYVGALTLPSGRVLEILPKVPMTSSLDDEKQEARDLFLKMLRYYRGIPRTSDMSRILSLRNFNMLSCFIRLFLKALLQLVHEGLARQYITELDNLPYLKGRIEFKEHLRQNIVNKARFYSSFGELSVNRPVNRLIVTTLNKLQLWVGYADNRKLLKELQVMFAEVPPSHNIPADWSAQNIDRSMPHYTEIMNWIGLFLFGHGLTTYAGTHSNFGIFFPMEKVFEDFVTKCLQRHACGFQVQAQGPKRVLVDFDGIELFHMKPDITLKKKRTVFYVLDAKWKVLDRTNLSKNFHISQSDLYQLYTYGEQYRSKAVVLIYPMNARFLEPLRFQFTQGIPLICFPFDIRDTKSSVDRLMNEVIHSKIT